MKTTDNHPRLLDCPDCGHKVSFRAPSCPRCGGRLHPIDDHPCAPGNNEYYDDVNDEALMQRKIRSFNADPYAYIEAESVRRVEVDRIAAKKAARKHFSDMLNVWVLLICVGSFAAVVGGGSIAWSLVGCVVAYPFVSTFFKAFVCGVRAIDKKIKEYQNA
jgi:hypothetical protein